MTITGANFTAATDVKFGSNSAVKVTVTSDSSIAATSPPGAVGTADITVTTPAGTSAISSHDHFKFAPEITGLSANVGSIAGGTSVVVTGAGFALGKTATLFKFGPTKAQSVNCLSTTECTVVAPAHAAGNVDVKATVDKVSSAKTSSDQFGYS